MLVIAAEPLSRPSVDKTAPTFVTAHTPSKQYKVQVPPFVALARQGCFSRGHWRTAPGCVHTACAAVAASSARHGLDTGSHHVAFSAILLVHPWWVVWEPAAAAQARCHACVQYGSKKEY